MAGPGRVVAAAFLAVAAASPAWALDPTLGVTQYSLESWSIDDGLPQNTVNAVLQTRDRYLWVGTYDGLARFDGVRFEVFTSSVTPGLRSNGIRGLWEDDSGTLWIGTNGGGVSRYRDGRFTHVGGALQSALVRVVRQDRAGRVWIGTSGAGLFRMLGDEAVREETGPGGDSVYAITQDLQGTLWVATHGGGLKRRGTDGAWSSLTTADGLPADMVSSLAVDGSGQVWMGTVGSGIAVLHEGRVARRYTAQDGLGSDIVWALAVDRDGSMWAGTAGGGLSRIRGDEIETLTPERGLPESVIYSLHEDREGTLWVGTNGGGLARLRSGTFASFGTREGLPHDFATTIHEGKAGLWAGTVGGLARWNGRRWEAETIPGVGSNAPVRAITEDGAGDLWVATYGAGVAHRKGGRWRLHTRATGLASDSVRSVVVGRDGTVWVATINGLSRLRGDTWTTLRTADGLPHNSLIALYEDETGALWVGSDGAGVTRIAGDRLDTFRKADGLASDLVLALVGARGGGVWIGTNGGLSLHREGRFTSWDTRAGLPTDAVAQVVEDGMGHVWLGSSRGVSRIVLASLVDQAAGRRPTAEVVTFGAGDGMRSAQCSAPAQPGALRTRDGRLWFPTVRGLASIDPARIVRDTEPPPVVIERVLVDGQDVDPRRPLVLPPGTARLEVQYTGLCLLTPRRVKFETMLEGLDTSWADAGNRRVAYYTALPPGNYRFRVRAANGDGVWNEAGAELPLRLEPTFAQTPWFYVMGAGALAALVYGGHRRRISALRDRERELGQLVEERTRRLHEEKVGAELARTAADEQRLIALRADSLKTELLGIAAHDLKNPLQTILGYAEAIAMEAPPATREMAQAIERSSRKMVRLIDDLLTTAALDGGSLEMNTQPLDLVRVARSYVEDVMPLAERKRQQLRLESTGPALVRGDEARLRQVVQNLVGNALKFSKPETEVVVRVSTLPGHARLTVSDQGPGLTAADRERLFIRFARLSARPTANEGSTGLGLSIVKRLVEAHGGTVWAESEPGQGSTFVVELPALPAS